MKEFFKKFIDGFLSALLMIVIISVLLAPLAIVVFGGSDWWLIVWVVDLCVGHGIAKGNRIGGS